jgi:hypothetical protein
VVPCDPFVDPFLTGPEGISIVPLGVNPTSSDSCVCLDPDSGVIGREFSVCDELRGGMRILPGACGGRWYDGPSADGPAVLPLAKLGR